MNVTWGKYQVGHNAITLKLSCFQSDNRHMDERREPRTRVYETVRLTLLGDAGDGSGTAKSRYPRSTKPRSLSRNFVAVGVSGATTKMVSSPAMVPTTSGQSSLSSATASALAFPGDVRNTIRFCATRASLRNSEV